MSAPLVTAIMPTRGRDVWAYLAVQAYLRQTYIPRELVVLDDVDCPSFPAGLHMPERGVRYYQCRVSRNIGQKRNIACVAAAGEYIIHWDDDDWSAPERIATQVEHIEKSGKAVSGFRSVLFVTPDRQAYRYTSKQVYVVGSTLIYRRDWWVTHRFKPIVVEEDNAFGRVAREADQLDAVRGNQTLLVARIHDGNTDKKTHKLASYDRVPSSEIPEGFLRQYTS
jgi:glycosyltransferase involved in cell wall biosynthesis